MRGMKIVPCNRSELEEFLEAVRCVRRACDFHLVRVGTVLVSFSTRLGRRPPASP